MNDHAIGYGYRREKDRPTLVGRMAPVAAILLAVVMLSIQVFDFLLVEAGGDAARARIHAAPATASAAPVHRAGPRVTGADEVENAVFDHIRATLNSYSVLVLAALVGVAIVVTLLNDREVNDRAPRSSRWRNDVRLGGGKRAW
jgi:hypothetical protein